MPQAPRKHSSKRTGRPIRSDTLARETAGKASQRERLLDAMIQLAGHEGYQNVSIAALSSAAGVSRATFYEQFADKEECLLAAWQTAAERLMEQAPPMAVSNGDWPEAAGSLLRSLAMALERDPDAARLLFVETLTGGSRARATQRIVLGAFERRVQEFIDSATPTSFTIDVPAIALLGALRSIVARHVRTHSEDELISLCDDGITWVRSYAVPAGREHWSTGPEARLPESPGDPLAAAGRRRLRRLPRGRHGLPAGVIARSQRTRIIYGTAEVMMSKGYENVTVADIVAAAGVSRDVFYENFTDKHDAFLEAQQHPTQHILDTCAAAYFSVQDWPERIWSLFSVLLEMVVANPAISHLRLVECYAAGPDAIRRAEEITRSFTIFLEEGYGYRPEARELPHLCSQAIAGAIFEIIQRHVARGDGAGLTRRLPELTYIAVAPFLGPDDAIARISELRSRHPALVNASGHPMPAKVGSAI